jgi:hypothetical protein
LPVLQQSALSSPPTNAFGLYQYLAQRIPGYDPSEYLRELNSSYIHVWEEVVKLKINYFTNLKTVTVATAQFEYDLMFNADNGLSAPVSQRIYQITRVRIQAPGGGMMQMTRMVNPNEPDFIALAANPQATPQTVGPYLCYPTGRNNLRFALPLAVGSTIEVTYTFWPIALVMTNTGTISSSGATVTGSGTFFTQLLQPDFQASLPAVSGQEEIMAELVYSANNASLNSQINRVKTITSDTVLTTANAIAPALAASSQYVLATLPEIPREHIRVIAAIALRNMYSVAGDDTRVAEWTALAASNMQMMKDSLMERQGQNPPTKKRFPYGVGRLRNYFRY